MKLRYSSATFTFCRFVGRGIRDSTSAGFLSPLRYFTVKSYCWSRSAQHSMRAGGLDVGEKMTSSAL